MPINNSKLQMKTLTYVGTGAALVAIIGYLILKFKKSLRTPSSDPERKKYSEDELRSQNNENCDSDCNKDMTLNDLKGTSDVMNASAKTDQIKDNCEHSLEDTFKRDLNNNRRPSFWSNDNTNTISKNIKMNSEHDNKVATITKTPNDNLNLCEHDKLSDTSSDSGNGKSEIQAENISNEKIHSQNPNATTDLFELTREFYIDRYAYDNSYCTSEVFELNKIKRSLTSDNVNKIDTSKSKLAPSLSCMSFSSTQNDDDLVLYEFYFPRKLCGKLIGKKGVHVENIRNKTKAQIAVRNDPKLEDTQIVCVSGSFKEVDQALEIINERFPSKHYPQISLKPINKPVIFRRNKFMKQKSKMLVTLQMFVETPQLNTEVDVHVSAIVNSTHLFVHLPNNPTYQLLQKLDEDMLHLYRAEQKMIPDLNSIFEYGVICAAPTSYGWHRAVLTEFSEPDSLDTNGIVSKMAKVKFLDYGGYLDIPVNHLKQLRVDFMNLPFQAIEVKLEGIEKTQDDDKEDLQQLINNYQLKMVITSLTSDSIPLVKLYRVDQNYEKILINKLLISHGSVREN